VFSLSPAVRLFVATEAVDFRKAHDGLCAIIRDHLGADPFSGDVYVFFNRSRNRVKLLIWDGNGFWLHYKRLERGCFEALAATGSDRGKSLRIERAQLALLLEGIDLKSSRMWKHFARSARPGMRTDWRKRGDGASGHSARVGQRTA